MNSVLIGARMALVAVVAVAGFAKLADLAGSRSALEGFAVPRRLVPPLAFILPLLELTAAGLLAIAPTAQAGAALAAALVLAFIAGIVAALRRGRAPNCHCFGQLHSRPAGRETVARNAVLAAFAVLIVAAGPGPGIPFWFSHSGGVVVALVLVALLTMLLFSGGLALWQQNRQMTGRGRGPEIRPRLEVGQEVPAAALSTDDGTELTVTELLDGRRAIFVFTSATCAPCLELLPELARWREVLHGQFGIHVLASGDEAENRKLAAEHGVQVLLDPDGSAASSFGVLGTPTAIEIDASGRVAAPAAVGAPAIEALVRAALARPSEAPALEIRYAGGSLGAPPASAPI